MAKKTTKSALAAKQSKSAPESSRQPGTSSKATIAPVSSKPPSIFSKLTDIRAQRTFQLILLAALSAPLSQLNLSPVYGAIPAGLYHRYGVIASFLLAVGIRGYLPKALSRWIATFSFWIPTFQFLLFQLSSSLGNPAGPVITELLTVYPLITSSVYIAVEYFDDLCYGTTKAPAGNTVPAMGLFVLFTVLQRAARSTIASFSGPGFLRSRVGLQLIIGMLYAMVIPKSLVWPAFPSVVITMIANPHCTLTKTTEVLNNTLGLYDYTILERQESITGYISVLEDNQKGFRVMRCDHSLLGGEWKIDSTTKAANKVGDPIYSIFTMLEAVRLVEPSSTSTEKTALNIGLGVGTAPSAMIAHGINTTILEIDPVVHEFAVKYFNLPYNHSYYIGDAVAIVGSSVANAQSKPETSEAESYDYIIHDVFTGGAEPVELFTEEFLAGLHLLLKSDGVIAINYAGDLSMPSASIVYRTIISVFPSCRAFREEAAPVAGTKQDDFTNMVFFCRKTDIPVNFRKPVETDFLGSRFRREYLMPKYEIPSSVFETKGSVLKNGKTKELEKWQAKSAIGHWRVMRTVLPDAIWINW
ncbi:hypothetical protein LTR84_007968 [Exophiala bonariae]|uniref:PABS domain-containing protein n=1 Tax=Exophiala bonariae TaxID=1690606 RepID=A0AAV9NQN0_9EURO|nr:hypothetical protein LTR84_007968 [Exophiala bonariae]